LAAGLTAGLDLTEAAFFIFTSFGSGGFLYPARITRMKNTNLFSIAFV
jgi:hypothetical protein